MRWILTWASMSGRGYLGGYCYDLLTVKPLGLISYHCTMSGAIPRESRLSDWWKNALSELA